MLRRLGYVASNYTIGTSTARTCRLANATPERLRELIGSNLSELEQNFRFNAENDIKLYRLSSQVIPFASHPRNELAWWDEFSEQFGSLGALAEAHDFRLSMHPGQYTVLNSPNPAVVAASIAELESATKLLDTIRDDPSGKVILHLGGAYGDKPESMKRFEEAYRKLSDAVRRRLVIENDDTVYSAEEVLSLADTIGIPVVFDWLHHLIRPSSTDDHAEIIRRCFATWGPNDGPPKVHLSTQSVGGRVGHHHDFIDPADLVAFQAHIPDVDYDLMIEAKQKDLALFRLRDWIRSGEEVPVPAPSIVAT